MEQVNNGFANYYYLDKQGNLFNIKNNSKVKSYNNSYKLQTVEGKTKSISIKKLYYLVYNEIFIQDTIEDLQGEIWKEIADTEGKFYVSNKGRVKSYCGMKARILKPTITQKGYKRLQIIKFGKKLNKFIHTLVLETFKGQPPKQDMEIHHKDFNKLNNCIENLEYLTIKEHVEIHNRARKEIKEDGGI